MAIGDSQSSPIALKFGGIIEMTTGGQDSLAGDIEAKTAAGNPSEGDRARAEPRSQG